jgi:hypothetical protein
LIIGPSFQEESFKDLLGYVSRGCPVAGTDQAPVQRPSNPFEPKR